METDKNSRLLYLYEALICGEGLQKKEAAARFGVNERSIQRDIDCLRNFFAGQDPPREILYNAKEQRYELTSTAETFLTCGELLAVCKILLDSRSMPKAEMDAILDKLLDRCTSPQSRKLLEQILANERFYYIEPHHGKRLSERLWTLGQAVWSRSVTEVTYHTQRGKHKERRLQPVGLLFSEYYFYLTAFIEDIDRAAHFDNAEDPFPTIYRVDRIEKIRVLDEHFHVPYSRRFSEGEFRKRVQFMYGGKLETVHFIYKGPSVEAVLDRLPTAEILSERDGCYEIRAEVFGRGIEMWLRSQGDYIERME